ncbi:MAG: hypothetical protein HY825_12720 [Acidobacteria bacterium]|nr:hypothetical protein [Acidobacteriota bacterium]
MTDPTALRAELRRLVEKQARGDIGRRDFDRQLAEGGVALVRALVSERLGDGERIVAEHHAVLGHLRLASSVLAEPEQEAISLFLTGRRLLRLRCRIIPGRPPTGDDRDGTVIDEVPIATITALGTRRRVRIGEVAAGAVITALALVFKPWLLITGTLLAGLGIAGMLHGLLLPTRWVEIQGPDRGADDVFRVHAMGRKSGRALLARLRAATAGG